MNRSGRLSPSIRGSSKSRSQYTRFAIAYFASSRSIPWRSALRAHRTAIPLLYSNNRVAIRWALLLAAIWPIAYMIYTFAHGTMTGFYPYPFVNVDRLGLGTVLLNAVGVTLLLVAVGGL